MCCKKNRNRTDAYGHVSRGECYQRRGQRRCHGSLLALLIDKIIEHRAKVKAGRLVIYQDEVDTRGKRDTEITKDGNPDSSRTVRRHRESAQEESEPPSYESVMKND